MTSHPKMFVTGLILLISMQWTSSAPGKDVLPLPFFIQLKNDICSQYVKNCICSQTMIACVTLSQSIHAYFTRERLAWAPYWLLEKQRQTGTFQGLECSAKHQKGKEHDPLHRRWWVWLSLWHNFVVLSVSSHVRKPETGLKLRNS